MRSHCRLHLLEHKLCNPFLLRNITCSSRARIRHHNGTDPLFAQKRWQSVTATLPSSSNLKQYGRSERDVDRKFDQDDDHSPLNVLDPARWVDSLEPFLPPHLRSHTYSGVSSSRSPSISGLMAIDVLVQARRTHNIDLLSWLGLEQQRWAVVLWLAKQIIDHARPRSRNFTRAKLHPVVGINSLQNLDQLTQKPIHLDINIIADVANLSLQKPMKSTPQVRSSLSSMALDGLWRTIGRLILTASQRDNEANNIMSCVIDIMAYLYRRGFISTTVYDTDPNDDPSAFQRPLWLTTLSPKIMALLSAPTESSDHKKVKNIGIHERKANPMLSAHKTVGQSAIPQFAPETWFEFLLWCCIEDSWYMAAAGCLREMENLNGSLRWTVKNSAESTKNLSGNMQRSKVSSDHSIPTGSAKRPKGSPSISVEVIVALMDGIIINITSGSIPQAINQKDAIKEIIMLRNLIKRDNLGSARMSWDAVIARIGSNEGLNIEARPASVAYAMQAMAPQYEGKTTVTTQKPNNVGLSSIANYIHDGTALIIGFYHRVLHAHVKAGNLGAAIQDFADLQSLTDLNKKRSLEEFFKVMKQRQPDDSKERSTRGRSFNQYSDLNFKHQSSRIEFPGFFPRIPSNILADFLDLITEFRAFEIGLWMVNNTDIDGPLVSQSSYDDPFLAPALIRFATESGNTDLLSTVVNCQSSDIPVETMLALCSTRIQFGDYAGASAVLTSIREFTKHAWTADDIARLASSVLKQSGHSLDASDPAAILLLNLFRSDGRRSTSRNFMQIESLFWVFSTINTQLSAICSPFLRDRLGFKFDLPATSFNMVLEAAVHVYGSSRGRMLWEQWCRNDDSSKEPSVSHIEPDKSPDIVSVESKGMSISMHESETSVDENMATRFEGRVIPNLATIRIIIQAAVNEQQPIQPDIQTGAGEEQVKEDAFFQRNTNIFYWVAQRLLYFGLKTDDITYELQGYLPDSLKVLPPNDPYSLPTLRVWGAFTGLRKSWAESHEAKLRLFAKNESASQLTFEPMPATERYLIHQLAHDFGLGTASHGTDTEKAVTVFKRTETPSVPLKKIDETLRYPDHRYEDLK